MESVGRKVFIKTLGCKSNSFDSSAMAAQLVAKGFEIVTDAKIADVTLVNTCSVTSRAEKEARHLLRRYQNDNPKSLRIVTGCYAQTDSAGLSSMAEVDWVVPNSVKPDLAAWLAGLPPRREVESGGSKVALGAAEVAANRQGHFKSAVTLFDRSDVTPGRTRAFLKIQDGCNGFCAYCIIPYARGASRSVPEHQVLAEVERLVDEGVYEIVLTGIHVGDVPGFADLLRKILETPGLGRLRISSLEPNEVTEEVVKVLADHADKVCDHFHLPLQSGDEGTLRRMRRRYTPREYSDVVEMLRRSFPDLALGCDVIPGFPGESEAAAQATEEFVLSLGVTYLHVFPYSRRPNTAAVRMPDHIDPAVIRERAGRLRQISVRLSEQYARQCEGSQVDVVWEERRSTSGQVLGVARNYLQVVATDFCPQVGTCSRVRVGSWLADSRGVGAGVVHGYEVTRS